MRNTPKDWPGFDRTVDEYSIATGGGDAWGTSGSLPEAITDDWMAAHDEDEAGLAEADAFDWVNSVGVYRVPGGGGEYEPEYEMALLHQRRDDAAPDGFRWEWETHDPPRAF